MMKATKFLPGLLLAVSACHDSSSPTDLAECSCESSPVEVPPSREELYRYRAELLRVVDGDTLDLKVDLGFQITHTIRVRLSQVDTPEMYSVKKGTPEYKAGVAARQFVQDWFLEKGGRFSVETLKDRKGKYGRYLAKIYPLDENVSLSEAIIAAGHGHPIAP